MLVQVIKSDLASISKVSKDIDFPKQKKSRLKVGETTTPKNALLSFFRFKRSIKIFFNNWNAIRTKDHDHGISLKHRYNINSDKDHLSNVGIRCEALWYSKEYKQPTFWWLDPNPGARCWQRRHNHNHNHSYFHSFLIKWANPSLFLFIFVLSTWHKSNIYWEKHWWCAWDSNPGLQNEKYSLIHWAMAATSILASSNFSFFRCRMIASFHSKKAYNLVGKGTIFLYLPISFSFLLAVIGPVNKVHFFVPHFPLASYLSFFLFIYFLLQKDFYNLEDVNKKSLPRILQMKEKVAKH